MAEPTLTVTADRTEAGSDDVLITDGGPRNHARAPASSRT